MLKMVEYGLLAVALMMIFGLIVSGARSEARPAEDALEAETPPNSGPLGSVPLPAVEAEEPK